MKNSTEPSPQEMSRDFKGIWIPREIWLCKELSITEKSLWAEIHSLHDRSIGACYASNEYLSRFLQCTTRNVQYYLSRLLKAGFLEMFFHEDQRYMRATISTEVIDFQNDVKTKIGGGEKSFRGGVKNLSGGYERSCTPPHYRIERKEERKEKKRKISASSAGAFSSFENPSSVEEVASQPNEDYQLKTISSEINSPHNITYNSGRGKSEQNKLKNNDLQLKENYSPPETEKIKRRHNVETTNAQHDSLVEKYGEELVSRAYDYLSEWKEDKPSKELKKASDYGRLKKWVFNAIKEADIKERELKVREEKLQNSTEKSKLSQELQWKMINEKTVYNNKERWGEELSHIVVRGNWVVNSKLSGKDILLTLSPEIFNKRLCDLIGVEYKP